MDLTSYIRADLRAFTGYRSAATSKPQALPPDPVWLNANESARTNAADPRGAVRRYPDPQPPELRAALAAGVGVDPAQVLIGRGSDELIDLLVRLTCAPGDPSHSVLVSTPTFGMYEISATLNATPVLDVPLRDDAAGWCLDTDAVVAALLGGTVRLAFVCSPANPTGQTAPAADVERILQAATERAIVVVDEAYVDFSAADSVVPLVDHYENLVVLRTLSKAYALAGARVGYAVARPELIRALATVQAPYPVPGPVADLALAAISNVSRETAQASVAEAVAQRDRLLAALADLPCTAYPSDTNFVLVRVPDPDRALDALRARGIIVRDARTYAALPDGIRITVGTPEQTGVVISTLTEVLS